MTPNPILTGRAPSAGYRRRLLVQIIGMVAVALGVGLSVLGFGYRAEMAWNRGWLSEMAQGQARLFEVMACAVEGLAPELTPDECFQAALNQLRKARGSSPGFMETGEFTLAELRGDTIGFLLNQRRSQLSEPAPLSTSSRLAESMHRALGGISGTMTGLDYQGVTVLAAHEPVRIQGRVIGIVAKVDLAEIQRPFRQASLRASLAALVLVVLGAILLRRIGEPVVRALEENERRLHRLFHDTGEAIFITSGDGIILETNLAGAELLGRSREDLIGRSIQDFYSLEGDRERFLEALRADGRTEGLQMDLRRADGTVIHALLTATARMGKGGEIESIETLVRDTTGEVQAAAAVEAERDRAELYLNTAETIMVSLDPQGKIAMINRRGCEILGHPEGSLVGKDWFSTCLPERDRDQVQRVFGTIMSGDTELFRTHENPVLSSTGEERLIAWHNTLVFDEDGAVKELFSCGQDVTEERRAEAELKVSEARVSKILEAAPIGIGVIVKRVIQEVNDRFCDLIGYSREELLGQSAVMVYPDEEEFLRVGREKYAEIERTGSGSVEARFLRKDGEIVNVIVSSVALTHDNAEGPVVFTAMDITKRKQAEEALRHERDKLRAIFEAMDDGVYIASREYEVEYVNPVLVADFGPYEGRKCYSYFHDREDVCPWCQNPAVFAGKTVQWEWTSLKNGRTYDLLDTQLRNADGSLSKLQILRDITERRRAEVEIRESREELRALAQRLEEVREEEKATLARDLHDDLGQSLTGLRMDLGSLRTQLPEESAFRGRVSELADLTDGLVDELRTICARLRPPILDVLGLSEAIEWQVGEFQKRSELEFDLDLDIGSPALEGKTATVAFRLIQESLVNVMRHADASRVRILLRREDGTLVGEIQDNGRGIPREEVDSPTSLGLLGMRERVLALEGEHSVEPLPEGGTLVRFRLPFLEAPPRVNGP